MAVLCPEIIDSAKEQGTKGNHDAGMHEDPSILQPYESGVEVFFTDAGMLTMRR